MMIIISENKDGLLILHKIICLFKNSYLTAMATFSSMLNMCTKCTMY